MLTFRVGQKSPSKIILRQSGKKGTRLAMSGGDGSLLEKRPYPNCLDSKKVVNALSTRSFRETPTSKRL